MGREIGVHPVDMETWDIDLEESSLVDSKLHPLQGNLCLSKVSARLTASLPSRSGIRRHSNVVCWSEVDQHTAGISAAFD